MSKTDLEIDENNLVEEWKTQAPLMLYHGTRAADALFNMDTAKASLALVKAQLEREIRQDPASFQLKKVTETTVPARVQEEPAYQAAVQELNNCRHKHGLAEAVVWALTHRKKALEGIAALKTGMYWADPAGPDAPEHEKPVEVTQADKKLLRVGRKRKRK